MLSLDFKPTIIGPNFNSIDNYSWLYDYLSFNKIKDQNFWESKYVSELKREVNTPSILLIGQNLDHNEFDDKFRQEWIARTKLNTPIDLRVEIDLQTFPFSPLGDDKNDVGYYINILIFSPKNEILDIESYFSIILDEKNKVALIDDYYPNIYNYGWGGSSRIIIPNLIKYIKDNSPFKIETIYTCSINETYGFWEKMGFQLAEANNWGDHMIKI